MAIAAAEIEVFIGVNPLCQSLGMRVHARCPACVRHLLVLGGQAGRHTLPLVYMSTAKARLSARARSGPASRIRSIMIAPRAERARRDGRRRLRYSGAHRPLAV